MISPKLGLLIIIIAASLSKVSLALTGYMLYKVPWVDIHVDWHVVDALALMESKCSSTLTSYRLLFQDMAEEGDIDASIQSITVYRENADFQGYCTAT